MIRHLENKTPHCDWLRWTVRHDCSVCVPVGFLDGIIEPDSIEKQGIRRGGVYLAGGGQKQLS